MQKQNYGYGANQKTCYTEALKAEADIIVMVHPDYQYDPTLLPELIRPIEEGKADVVLGSRLMGKSPMSQGMPRRKYVSNRFLTALVNCVFGLKLAECHTRYRAYKSTVPENLNLMMNSDRFVFDQEIIAQMVNGGYRIDEVPVPTRYFREASSASFVNSCIYGLSILVVLVRYVFHRSGWVPQKQFQALKSRYQEIQPAASHDSRT
jgi:glycosyltransferase involved in cell wall biosynthesis